ncbi:NADPH-dependent F420 reductase [Orrella dioscoreae]|uniref:(AJ250023) putative polyketide synthase n=1 Tax=Orrella dioscoreae TaxID=1851544 RepID=A0A1C3JZW7_9BURK|nr:NAD(P)-binding domain-containing protein [Orrella dioscoreae]SBT24724.1 (AJ250023) putative polyketide synthase [Orrella dioscoreae]SOE50462.1 (AJ250023) putative polyketide synthase [Orrella dioscoreae]
MDIGIIGAGEIGGSLTRRLSKLGHKVSVANSRGPDSLAELAAETGATAVTVTEAASSGEIVFVAIPVWKIAELPKDLFDGIGPDIVVVDTGNYYPRERDGRIDDIETGMAESRWVANQLGRPVVKALNTLYWRKLLHEGKPAGAPGRIALPVAGDDEADKTKLIRLFDELGFDGIDAGGLDESWRQQPGTPVYATDLDAEGVRKALAEASPERKPEMRATPNSSLGKPI